MKIIIPTIDIVLGSLDALQPALSVPLIGLQYVQEYFDDLEIPAKKTEEGTFLIKLRTFLNALLKRVKIKVYRKMIISLRKILGKDEYFELCLV